MDILDIIAAAPTTSNNWVNQTTGGNMEAILTFKTATAATAVARELRAAGALVSTKNSGYGETLLMAIWQE
jgi:hypothetical protein